MSITEFISGAPAERQAVLTALHKTILANDYEELQAKGVELIKPPTKEFYVPKRYLNTTLVIGFLWHN
jgi:hypothetical protein